MKGTFWKEGSPWPWPTTCARCTTTRQTGWTASITPTTSAGSRRPASTSCGAGFPYEELEGLGILSPVLTAQAEYKSMTRFGETVDIAVDVESYTGTRIAFRYEVRDRDTGALRCQGRTAHCFLGGAGRPVSLKKAAPAYHQKVCAALAAREQEEWQ